MAPAAFLAAAWSSRWDKSYRKLPPPRQAACDGVAMALIKQDPTPGMRVKPIQPEKYYFEARISSGDRLVFRIEEGTIYFIDVVTHDEIGRFGHRPSPRQ